MNDQEGAHESGYEEVPTREQARELLANVPERPRRSLRLIDHLCAVLVIGLALASGMEAVGGDARWAVIPAVGALMIGGWWIAHRRARPNEPRFEGGWILVMGSFPGVLSVPIWRGIRRDEAVGFPEAFFVGGVAAALALAFYLALLIRR